MFTWKWVNIMPDNALALNTVRPSTAKINWFCKKKKSFRCMLLNVSPNIYWFSPNLQNWCKKFACFQNFSRKGWNHPLYSRARWRPLSFSPQHSLGVSPPAGGESPRVRGSDHHTASLAYCSLWYMYHYFVHNSTSSWPQHQSIAT